MQNKREEYLADPYEPYENRQREGTTGRCTTLIHLVKGILGCGILALPEAYKNSGFVIGTVGNIVITALITYCLHILFKSMYVICKKEKIPEISYPQTFLKAVLMGPEWLHGCAPFAPTLVNALIIIFQVGTICVYLIFCASNVKQVVDINTDDENHLSQEMYMILILLLLIPLVYIKNLKWLAPVSFFGNVVTLFGLISIYYFTCQDLPPIGERLFFAPIQLFPLFMGTAMCAVLSIGTILTLELNAEDPKYWGGLFGTLNQGMVIVTFLNCFTGHFGYWKYGDETSSSITLNIDINHPLAQTVRIFFSLAIYLSFALQAYPVTEILWEQYIFKYMETSKHPLMWDYVVRSIMVLASFILAITIPRLGLFISLFGAFCLSLLGILFPPLIDICLRWPDNFGKAKYILVRDLSLMLFAILGWVTGTYCAIDAIIRSFL